MKRLSDEYFAKIYEANPDPWGFESRWYEARKYALSLAALPHARYTRAFEPGCANGVLTAQLAERCDALVASDVVPSVVTRARSRLTGHAHVEVRSLAIPEAWPEGSFDLIVLSEVVYYLTGEGTESLLSRVDASLAPAGHVLAVHWTGATNYPQSGDEAHAALDAHPALARIVSHRDEAFVLAVYARRAP